MTEERFTLEGYDYLLEYRGEYGPYWYKRKKGSNRREYVGKELPHSVQQARQYHELYSDDMQRLIEQKRIELRTLVKLWTNAKLDKTDLRLIGEIDERLLNATTHAHTDNVD